MYKIALAGNPNVGKSTIFNSLTGKNQHTGNWTGKTVDSCIGNFKYKNKDFELIDLPGTYSLISHSKEEEIARNYLCFNNYDLCIVVVDSLSLERNLNLVLQVLEITNNVVICCNFISEAKKKNIYIDLHKLEEKLGVGVVGIDANNRKSIELLLDKIINFKTSNRLLVKYNSNIENRINELSKVLDNYDLKGLNPRFVSLRLLDNSMDYDLTNYLGYDLRKDKYINNLLEEIPNIKDIYVTTIIKKSEIISKYCVSKSNNYIRNKLDYFLTNKITGIPMLLLFISFIFFLTITLSNYPSELLFNLFSYLEVYLIRLLNVLNITGWLNDLIIGGVYRTLTWVVSVMLPPMAIFFPLFTILEDFGLLPRIAFNLDKGFQKCNACGKQSLCMMMGFGCNAVGVVGSRIIDSKRERLTSILTNCFVPCNGRFPMIIVIISMFLVNGNNSYYQAFYLLLVIIFSVFMTFLVSFILSKTILKGNPTSFILELPPYRKVKIFKVIVRSMIDKTLHILVKSVIVTVPASIIIWMCANLRINDISILSYINNFLEPFGRLIGVDGVILTSFLLALPANEIVIPIMIMSYLKLGIITDYNNILELKNLLINNNWTILTAVNTIILTLMHFPCSTTLLAIKKETNSIKWMIYSILIPLICGIICCFIVNLIFN